MICLIILCLLLGISFIINLKLIFQSQNYAIYQTSDIKN